MQEGFRNLASVFSAPWAAFLCLPLSGRQYLVVAVVSAIPLIVQSLQWPTRVIINFITFPRLTLSKIKYARSQKHDYFIAVLLVNFPLQNPPALQSSGRSSSS